MPRLLLLLTLALTVLVAGCGGDDKSAAGSKDDPATAVPAAAPVAARFSTDLDGDLWKKSFAFAEKVDPGDRDLKAMLIKELDSDGEVKYSRDVKPWIGDEAVFFLTDYNADAGEPKAGFVAQVDDEDAAQKLVDKEARTGKKASYKGTDYVVLSGDDGALGKVKGFVVFTSDEASFKAAVDAAGGSSLADQSRYRDAMDEAPGDAAATVYADVDRTLALLQRTRAVPAQTLDLIKRTPGFKAGQAATVAVVPAENEMAVEATGASSGVNPADGPKLEDLAGGAWFAAAGPFQGDQFAAGFEQGLSQAGGAQALQLLQQLGLADYLRQLKGFSARFGGSGVLALNGEVTLQGTDAAAAKKLLQGAAGRLKAAGAPAKLTGSTLQVNVPPYTVTATATGADVKVTVGSPPAGKLGDEDAFKKAKDALDLDRASAFVDFAGIEQLVRGIPSTDSSTQEVLRVLPNLGALIAGSEVADGKAHTRLVLTTRK